MSNLVSIFRRTWPLSCWSITVIPSSMTISSSLLIFWEDPYYQPAPPLSEEGLYLRPVLPIRGESISLTCSSFLKKVHIFDLFFLSEEILYHRPVSPFREGSISSTYFSFSRRVLLSLQETPLGCSSRMLGNLTVFNGFSKSIKSDDLQDLIHSRHAYNPIT